MKMPINTWRYATILFAAAIISCNTGDDTSDVDTDSSTADTSTAAGSVAVTNPDQEAVTFLVSANTQEMAWLQAAINNNSASKQVKSHAQMMMKDHQQMGNDVNSLATQRNWTLPSADTTGVVNINNMTGKEWDKAWTDKMVQDHQMLLDRLNQFETSVQDTAFRSWITRTKPVVQKHIDMSKQMQGNMK